MAKAKRNERADLSRAAQFAQQLPLGYLMMICAISHDAANTLASEGNPHAKAFRDLATKCQLANNIAKTNQD